MRRLKMFEITKKNAFEKLGRAVNELVDNKVYQVEIRERNKKRSLDANAYAWVLLDKLAEKTGISKIEIYRDIIKNVGGNSVTGCFLEKDYANISKDWQRNGIGWICESMPSKLENCITVIFYEGSSVYDTRQMSRFINLIIQECEQQEIETKTPEEISNLLSLWGSENE